MARESSPIFLIVDDEALILDLLRTFLEGRLNCAVLTATNGHDALALVREHDISLMLTEVAMSGMDGAELVRRARLLRPNLRACFVSGCCKQDVPEVRGTPFVQKPFQLAGLLSVLQEMSNAQTTGQPQTCELA